MTKEEYRQHIRKYSRDTMVMSYVVTKHPDYQALQAAGDEIIPWLLEDMLDPNWHCDACYGEGFKFPDGWVWDSVKRNWPSDTGVPCPKCGGKGSISSWGCMSLLWDKVGRDNGPKIENWMRGRHDVLCKCWQKWGEARGYLPPTPDAPKPDFPTRVGHQILDFILGWFRMGA